MLESPSLLSFVWSSTPFAKAVLLVLLLFSLTTWYVMALKAWGLWCWRRSSKAFQRVVAAGGWTSPQVEGRPRLKKAALASAQYQLFVVARAAGQKALESGQEAGAAPYLEAVKTAMQKALDEHCRSFEKALPLLATAATVAPYIGLLGTVLGVMGAFLGLGAGGNNTLAAVAPGIAESLIATALGLFVAIPALMAYNFFTHQSGRMEEALLGFVEEWAQRIH